LEGEVKGVWGSRQNGSGLAARSQKENGAQFLRVSGGKVFVKRQGIVEVSRQGESTRKVSIYYKGWTEAGNLNGRENSSVSQETNREEKAVPGDDFLREEKKNSKKRGEE